jgi:hypothetical protein
MYQTCDGPGVQGNIVVSTTPVLLKVGSTALEDRDVVSIQPIDGIVYFGYDNTVTASTGTKVFKNQFISLEAADKLTVYLVTASGSVNVRITEKS